MFSLLDLFGRLGETVADAAEETGLGALADASPEALTEALGGAAADIADASGLSDLGVLDDAEPDRGEG